MIRFIEVKVGNTLNINRRLVNLDNVSTIRPKFAEVVNTAGSTQYEQMEDGTYIFLRSGGKLHVRESYLHLKQLLDGLILK